MNPRLNTNGLFVDHVLGWAVGLGDAEAAGASGPGPEDQGRPSGAGKVEERIARSDQTKDSRFGGLRFL